MKNKLALFDFDGTLVQQDSLWDFLFTSFPKRKVLGAILKNGTKILEAKFDPKKRSLAKESLLKSVFENMASHEIQLKGKEYGLNIPESKFTDNYAEFLRLKDTHTIIVVSASLDIWLASFAKKEGVDLICTKWDYDNNRFASKNCNYEEKKNRILSEVDLSQYDEIIAFGDSKGDHAMYSLVKK